MTPLLFRALDSRFCLLGSSPTPTKGCHEGNSEKELQWQGGRERWGAQVQAGLEEFVYRAGGSRAVARRLTSKLICTAGVPAHPFRCP